MSWSLASQLRNKSRSKLGNSVLITRQRLRVLAFEMLRPVDELCEPLHDLLGGTFKTRSSKPFFSCISSSSTCASIRALLLSCCLSQRMWNANTSRN